MEHNTNVPEDANSMNGILFRAKTLKCGTFIYGLPSRADNGMPCIQQKVFSFGRTRYEKRYIDENTLELVSQ